MFSIDSNKSGVNVITLQKRENGLLEGVLIVYCNVFLDNSQFPHFRISFYFDVINYEIDFNTPNFTHSDNELRKKAESFLSRKTF